MLANRGRFSRSAVRRARGPSANSGRRPANVIRRHLFPRPDRYCFRTCWPLDRTSQGRRIAMSPPTVTETSLAGVPLLFRGKVRDIYDLGEQLLLVATDRISAFDVVLPTPIPDKGTVLTNLSSFW